MAITFSPNTTLTDVYKPDATIFDLSATSDDVDFSYMVYLVIVEDFPDTSIISVDEFGVHITGDTSEEFLDSSAIQYMYNGITPRTTFEPDDILLGDDLTGWLPDPTLSKDVAITIQAEAFDIGDVSLEFAQDTYTLTIYNTWDAHKAAVNALMEKLY